jgi:hypothetical protein
MDGLNSLDDDEYVVDCDVCPSCGQHTLKMCNAKIPGTQKPYLQRMREIRKN